MTTEAPGRAAGVPAAPAAEAAARGGSAGARAARRRRFPWWTLLGAVAVASLVVGSGVLRSGPPSPAARAAAIEAGLRCPSCQDVSVAQSDAPTAVAVRAAVRQQIAEGRTDGQIDAYLVSRYGSSIELAPPASGWPLVVWLLPVGAGLAALVWLGRLLVRRQRALHAPAGGREAAAPAVPPPAASVSGRASAPAGEGLESPSLAARRDFLLRSLADADAEYLAGDLSDPDYLALRRRDLGELERLSSLGRRGAAEAGTTVGKPAAVTEGATAAADADAAEEAGAAEAGALGPAAAPAGRRRRRRSWWYLGGAVAAFAGALLLTVSQLSSSRLPGQAPTGAALPAGQQLETSLAQAATDEGDGQIGEAASLYQSVLSAHPDNEVALAQLGWIEFEAGHPTSNRALLSDARAKLERAARLDPSDYAARLYLGTLLFEQDGSAQAAVAQFRAFLADRPPSPIVSQAAPVLRRAFAAAGEPLPPEVPGA